MYGPCVDAGLQFNGDARSMRHFYADKGERWIFVSIQFFGDEPYQRMELVYDLNRSVRSLNLVQEVATPSFTCRQAGQSG
jgi:hypothetical protein